MAVSGVPTMPANTCRGCQLTTPAARARMPSWMDLEKIPVAMGDMNDAKGLKASAEI